MLALALLVSPVPVLRAQASFQSGIYVTPDNRYSITVMMTSAGLEVTEPNRKSLYKRRGDVSRYYSVAPNGKEYGIRLAERGTIYSFTAAGETMLRLKQAIQEQTGMSDADLAPASTVPTHASLDAFNKWKAKINENPADAHLYAACGAAAVAKATFNPSGYREYTRLVVAGLKQLLVNPRANPCPDAIDNSLWSSAS
jgi:hypothetical protein